MCRQVRTSCADWGRNMKRRYYSMMIAAFCLLLTGCGEKNEAQEIPAIRALEEKGYKIEKENTIIDYEELKTADYLCGRIILDYEEAPENTYSHKEDYFCFYDKKTGEFWDIVHFEVSGHYIGEACGFGILFDDINFDGHEDLLIESGTARGGSSYYCAYLWTDNGFRYEETFDRIGSYQAVAETKSIIGYYHEVNDYDWYTYYRYTDEGFMLYREEYDYTHTDSSIKSIVRDIECGTESYRVEINPELPLCRIEAEKVDKSKEWYHYEGVDYEIKVYASEDSEDAEYIFYEKVYELPSLDVKFEDLDFDGNKDMMFKFVENGLSHMNYYNIYFWNGKGYTNDCCVKDFICNSYRIYEEKKLVEYSFTAYEDAAGSAGHRGLVYFLNGELIPVRELFYKNELSESGKMEYEMTVNSYQGDTEIEMFHRAAESMEEADVLMQEAESIFYEPVQ